MIGIYSITHIATGRKYIGASTDIQSRWTQHIRKAAKGKGSYIHKAMAQYGVDQFLFRVEIECDVSQLVTNEVELISSIGTRAPDGFNLTAGGEGVFMGVHKVCVLSDTEVGRMVHHHINPSCGQHRHIKVDVAVRAILNDKFELIDHDGRQYITPPKLHVLRVTTSQLMPVTQRVIGNPLKHIQPARFSKLD